jgi:hypothetical protein
MSQTSQLPQYTRPNVTVRVAFTGTTPVFMSFLYPPSNDDLLHLVTQLAAERAKKPVE